MFDKGFLASCDFASQVLYAPPMKIRPSEKRRVEIGMAPIYQGKFMGKSRPERNFQALDGLHHQESEFSVEKVERQDFVERCSCLEVMFNPVRFLLKGQPIGPKAIVIDVGKVACGAIGIGDGHTARLDKVDLLLDRKRGLGEFHRQAPV